MSAAPLRYSTNAYALPCPSAPSCRAERSLIAHIWPFSAPASVDLQSASGADVYRPGKKGMALTTCCRRGAGHMFTHLGKCGQAIIKPNARKNYLPHPSPTRNRRLYDRGQPRRVSKTLASTRPRHTKGVEPPERRRRARRPLLNDFQRSPQNAILYFLPPAIPTPTAAT